MAGKRLSQLEVVEIFTTAQGVRIAPDRASKLVRRGLAEWRGGKPCVTGEGREAFRKWSGGVLP